MATDHRHSSVVVILTTDFFAAPSSTFRHIYARHSRNPENKRCGSGRKVGECSFNAERPRAI